MSAGSQIAVAANILYLIYALGLQPQLIALHEPLRNRTAHALADQVLAVVLPSALQAQ